jgi:hypothetical protein
LGEQSRVISRERRSARLYRTGFAEVLPELPNAPPIDTQLQRLLAKIETEIHRRVDDVKLVA